MSAVADGWTRRAVITVSPMHLNWAVKFLSDALYADLDELETAIRSGVLAARLQEVFDGRSLDK